MHADHRAGIGFIQHVALAEQLFGPLFPKDGAAVDTARHLEADAGREVGLNDAGDDIDAGPLCRDDAVDAGGSCHLRDTCDGVFHIVLGHQHQVGQLVDDDDDVAELFRNLDFLIAGHADFLVHLDGEAFALVERQLGLIRFFRLLFGARVEAGDVAGADLGKNLVPFFHFVDDPLEREDDFFGIVHHGGGEVGEAIVNL